MLIINLSEIKCENVEALLSWYETEKTKVRERFGSDQEALMYWPDDYYEKMEDWWKSFPEKEPIEVIKLGDKYEIIDGWHRLAISHKFNIQKIPCEVVNEP